MAKRKSSGGARTTQSSGFERPLQRVERGDDFHPSDSRGGSKPSPALSAGLYLVATPIGNAGDVTLRALDVFKRADAIACEDTRVTAKLLAVHGISAPLSRYDDHSARAALPKLLARMAAGAAIALVSDAGTPLVSDPGYRLVTACIEAGIAVTAVPGASSVMAALSLSGLPTDRFLFLGFPPTRTTARRRFLAEVASVAATLVVMESSRRLAASLADMAAIWGPRPAAVTRELTKMFEEVRRGDLAALAQHYHGTGAPKGEVTIVVAPAAGERPTVDAEAIDALLEDALATSSAKDAAASVAATTGLKRRDIYARAIALRRKER